MNNKSQSESEFLLRRQLDQARKEVSHSIALGLIRVWNVPIRNTDRAMARIFDFEYGLNGGSENLLDDET